MVATYDPIRAEQERIQNDLQNAQAEQARKTPNAADKASVRARKKSGKDTLRASAKSYQDTVEQYQAKYTGKATASPPKASPSPSTPGSGWVLEGNYGTRADANIIRRKYKDTHFVKVPARLKDGSYNVWIKEKGVGVGKSAKAYDLKGKIKAFKDRDRELEPPGAARWVDFGTLPEYKPPNFQLDKSGYKPLDYKPVEDKPMFQYTSFKTMDYKPIGGEPYYKPSGVGNEPYYKPHTYQPIGQFGSVLNNPPNISGLQRSESEPKKRKKRKKTSEPRIVGE